jgi:predicted deacylase
MKYLSLTLLFISISALATDFPDDPLLLSLLGIDSDSRIKGPPYSEIVDSLKSLETSHPETVQVITYGKTLKKRPLTIVKIALKNVAPKLAAIYIGGSIHGDEYLNIEDRLPAWFVAQSITDSAVATYLKKGGAIYIAPILNPDGYEKRERENGRGVDLNRDYTVKEAGVEGFKEIETSSLKSFLEKDLENDQRKLEIAMDYHCCIGALLYPWSFKGPVLSEFQKERHLAIANIMQSTIGTDVEAGTTPVILGYSAKGTSKDFYYENFGARGFTYEGRRGEEDKFFMEHTAMWNNIVKLIIKD